MFRESTLSIPASPWELSFTLLPGAGDGVLLLLEGDGLKLAVTRSEKSVNVRLETRWNVTTARFGESPVMTFQLSAPEGGQRFRLVWLDAAVRLYADDRLVDEDWPLGKTISGVCRMSCADSVKDARLSALQERPGEESVPLPCHAQFYVPPYHNASVGDCMPFVHDGRYRLFHLFDRRHHRSKQGLGAHQWAQISTTDLKTWELHPIAVGIDEQWEGSICTGSMIEHDGCVYAFYAVRMSDGAPARLTWAVSRDGVHFEKSGQYFSLTEPYEPVSARDPKVFRSEDGQYHMLVTTSLTDMPHGGCLAHLQSRDLMNWTQLTPMLVPGFSDQPECSDYFEWNGRYYLVFANHLTARYRISDHPFGPWRRPKDDVLVSASLAVPKTACLNGRRLVSGWLADGGWGGSLITHELIQRPDGTLGVRFIEEMMPALANAAPAQMISLDASAQYAERELSAPDTSFRLRGTLALTNEACASLLLRFGDAEYRVEFDRLEETVSFYTPRQATDNIASRCRLTGLNCMNEPFFIDLVLYEDTLLLLLPDGRMLMPPRLQHSGPCSLSLACRDGECSLTLGN